MDSVINNVEDNGNKRWFNEESQLHRTDGPAIEHADGSKYWYLNGVLHRTDGPAIEYANGSKLWYLNGVLHRTCTLLRTCPCTWTWGLRGCSMNPVIDKYGTKRWINEKGHLHRTDGPAIETDGYKGWFQNGVQHRTDGPAIEHAGGYKYWYLNGVPHRTDGPAVEYNWNTQTVWYKVWYLNGTELSEDLFLKLTKGPVKKLPLYLGMGFDQFISERLKINFEGLGKF